MSRTKTTKKLPWEKQNKARKICTFHIVIDGSHQCWPGVCAKHSKDLIPLCSYDNLWGKNYCHAHFTAENTETGEVKWPASPRTAHQQALLGLSPAAWFWSSFAHYTLPTYSEIPVWETQVLWNTGLLALWASQADQSWASPGWSGLERVELLMLPSNMQAGHSQIHPSNTYQVLTLCQALCIVIQAWVKR